MEPRGKWNLRIPILLFSTEVILYQREKQSIYSLIQLKRQRVLKLGCLVSLAPWSNNIDVAGNT